MAESRDVSAPSDCTSFLEFADRLNIPINQGYLNHISEQIADINFDLNAIEVGIKDSGTHEKFNERRLQNALWRAWWRQRSTRFNSGQKKLLREEEQELEPVVAEEINFLWGSDIKDIPTEYTLPDDLEAHELPVIGTYVDPHVIPGFSYRVRVCGNKEKNHLFDGKSLRLERIGAGYGKRLTFEDEDILDCENFFWSDSNPDGGFAFSVNVLSEGQLFKVVDSRDQEVGEAIVTAIDERQQILSSRMDDFQTILEVRVDFICKLTAKDEVPESKKVSLSGIAKVIKTPRKKIAVVEKIKDVSIPDFGVCQLCQK